jgi:hypothetical protein
MVAFPNSRAFYLLSLNQTRGDKTRFPQRFLNATMQNAKETTHIFVEDLSNCLSGYSFYDIKLFYAQKTRIRLPEKILFDKTKTNTSSHEGCSNKKGAASSVFSAMPPPLVRLWESCLKRG